VVMWTEEEEDSAVTTVKMVPMSALKGIWVRKNIEVIKIVSAVRNVMTEGKEGKKQEESKKILQENNQSYRLTWTAREG
jgi:hypothetical protein